jgi:hypothetical protein
MKTNANTVGVLNAIMGEPLKTLVSPSIVHVYARGSILNKVLGNPPWANSIILKFHNKAIAI